MGIESRRGSDPWSLVEPEPVVESPGASGVRAVVAEVMIASTLVFGPVRPPEHEAEAPHPVVVIVDLPALPITDLAVASRPC